MQCRSCWEQKKEERTEQELTWERDLHKKKMAEEELGSEKQQESFQWR